MRAYINRVEELGERMVELEANVDEKDWIMTVLGGLGEEWSAVITTLEGTQAMWTKEEVTTRLINEEMRRNILQGDATSSSHFTRGAKKGVRVVFRIQDSLEVNGRGTLRLAVDGGPMTINNVLVVPGLGANLLSVSQLTTKGVHVNIKGAVMTLITSSGRFIGKAHQDGGLFKLVATPNLASANAAVAKPSLEIWYNRYGHLSVSTIRNMATQGVVHRIVADLSTNEEVEKCSACLEGKMARKPFPTCAKPLASNPLDLVHTDLCGPITPTSKGGARYILTFLDDATRMPLPNVTPLEAWSGEKPDVSNLRTFGCICYYHVTDATRTKLEAKARVGMYLSHSLDHKGWRVWDLESGKVVVSRDVSFFENRFPTPPNEKHSIVVIPPTVEDTNESPPQDVPAERSVQDEEGDVVEVVGEESEKDGGPSTAVAPTLASTRTR
ncbi:unnamed protein product [Closterium sp. Yama58-4]|nr:unnamed protein product [Closterium sp. Yama58-4]